MSDVFHDLYKIVSERKKTPQEGSYTCYLFEKGLDKILKKIGEECAETIVAAKNLSSGNADFQKSEQELVGEICDLYYHITVMMVEAGISYEGVIAELDERSKKIGNLKTFRNTDKNT